MEREFSVASSALSPEHESTYRYSHRFPKEFREFVLLPITRSIEVFVPRGLSVFRRQGLSQERGGTVRYTVGFDDATREVVITAEDAHGAVVESRKWLKDVDHTRGWLPRGVVYRKHPLLAILPPEAADEDPATMQRGFDALSRLAAELAAGDSGGGPPPPPVFLNRPSFASFAPAARGVHGLAPVAEDTVAFPNAEIAEVQRRTRELTQKLSLPPDPFRGRDVAARDDGVFAAYEGDGVGTGLFVARFAPRGTHLVRYTGETITRAERAKREARGDPRRTYFLDLAAVTLSNRRRPCIDAGRVGSIARYANHSCVPNCRLERGPERSDEVWIVATRDLLPGEAVRVDYGLRGDATGMEECACGAPVCTGELQGRRRGRAVTWSGLAQREAQLETRKRAKENGALRRGPDLRGTRQALRRRDGPVLEFLKQARRLGRVAGERIPCAAAAAGAGDGANRRAVFVTSTDLYEAFRAHLAGSRTRARGLAAVPVQVFFRRLYASAEDAGVRVERVQRRVGPYRSRVWGTLWSELT